MDNKSVSLGFGGISMPLGSHIAMFYRNQEERRGVIMPFIKTGLERGAKCIYIIIIDEETRERLEEALRGMGVDVGAVLASSQLDILTTEETYLSEGYFSPEKMLDFLETALRNALEEGYDEIRITGEMSWALSGRPGVGKLLEYEAKLNQVLPRYPQVTICQYNISRFRGDTVVDVVRTHPDCILGGLVIHNHFYQAPEVFLRELRGRSD